MYMYSTVCIIRAGSTRAYELKGHRVAFGGRICGVGQEARQAGHRVRHARRRRKRGQRAARTLRVRALLVQVRAQEPRIRVHLHQLVNLRARDPLNVSCASCQYCTAFRFFLIPDALTAIQFNSIHSIHSTDYNQSTIQSYCQFVHSMESVLNTVDSRVYSIVCRLYYNEIQSGAYGNPISLMPRIIRHGMMNP